AFAQRILESGKPKTNRLRPWGSIAPRGRSRTGRRRPRSGLCGRRRRYDRLSRAAFRASRSTRGCESRPLLSINATLLFAGSFLHGEGRRRQTALLSRRQVKSEGHAGRELEAEDRRERVGRTSLSRKNPDRMGSANLSVARLSGGN